MHSTEDLDEYLDDLGQLMPFKLYTQICFCFSRGDDCSVSEIVAILTKGLERLTISFPWLAGQVVRENSDEDDLKIKAFEKVPRLLVKDLRDDTSAPTMDALRGASFPFSMLDESIIAPCSTLPGSSDESAPGCAPVFLLQANFIMGGLLLTIVGQHNTMDMVGQGQIMHLFSKACRNEPFTREELSSGNLERRNLIPLLEDPHEKNPEFAPRIEKPYQPQYKSNETATPPIPPSAPKCTWAYFTFHSSSLAALKSLATNAITPPSTYLSTDDALTAFIWQSIIRARLPRLDPTAQSILARAVDVRRYLNIPQTYPGFMQNMTHHTYNTLQTLTEEPLGAIASHLRAAVDPSLSNLALHTRALATRLHRATTNKSAVSITATKDPPTDIMLSSWTKLDRCNRLDFGLGLGNPEAVRRPRFEPVESLVYFMPRAEDGEVAVGVCLRDEDIEALRADEQFASFGKYVG